MLETFDVLGISHRTISWVYRESSEKQDTQPTAVLSVKISCWCKRWLAILFWAARKAKISQPLVTTKVVTRRASLNVQHASLWSRWVTVAENHSLYHSCKLKTGNWGWDVYVLSKIRQEKIGKMLPALILNFCYGILMVRLWWLLPAG